MPSVLTHCSRQYSVVSSSLLGTYSIPTTPIHIHPSRHCIASLLNTGRDIREQSQLSVQSYGRCCGEEEVVGIEERSPTICLHFCPRTYYSHFKLTPPYILYCTIESIPGILAEAASRASLGLYCSYSPTHTAFSSSSITSQPPVPCRLCALIW